MKLEYLPNEICIECFQYLNALDLFSSFNNLNHRFNQLIRSISLHLNFKNVNESRFNQICSSVFFNPNIKLRIISLKLFNTAAYDQIEKFISTFPLNRFSYLRSLTLVGMGKKHVESISFMLCLLTNLTHFEFPDLWYNSSTRMSTMMSALQTLKLKTLLMPYLEYELKLSNKTTQITNLTLLFCYPTYLFQVFKYVPMLKYLNIKRIGLKHYDKDIMIYDHSQLIFLKELNIDEYSDALEYLEILLRKTPNLKIFSIINSLYQIEMLDAHFWEYFITTSLSHLDFFNFKFTVVFYENYDILSNVFKRFQSDFWYKKHHWYNIYEFHEDSACIYTIPYAWNEYELMFQSCASANLPVHNSNIFNTVKTLTVQVKAIVDNYQYYFLNVESLKLSNETEFYRDPVNVELTMEHIIYLKKIMNFSKLKHLCIWRNLRLESSVLLQILKHASQLSSLFIHKSLLMSFLNNNELCTYLNRMIYELDINRCDLDYYMKSNELDLFCKTFMNLKQLECCIEKSNDFVFLLDHLPKLTNLKIYYSSRSYSDEVCTELKQTASQRNINCITEYRSEKYGK